MELIKIVNDILFKFNRVNEKLNFLSDVVSMATIKRSVHDYFSRG